MDLEWIDWDKVSKDEIDKYMNLRLTELKNIVRNGMETEFYKLLRARLAQTLRITEKQLDPKQIKINDMDTLIKLVKWNTMFKTVEEIYNFPLNILKVKEESNGR